MVRTTVKKIDRDNNFHRPPQTQFAFRPIANNAPLLPRALPTANNNNNNSVESAADGGGAGGDFDQSRANSLMSETTSGTTASQPDVHPFYKVRTKN